MKLGALPIQSNKIIMPKFWRKISLWILNKYFRTHHSKIEMKVYWLSQELNCHIKKYIIDSWKSAEKSKICFNESILQKGEEYIFTSIFVAFCWNIGINFVIVVKPVLDIRMWSQLRARILHHEFSMVWGRPSRWTKSEKQEQKVHDDH